MSPRSLPKHEQTNIIDGNSDSLLNFQYLTAGAELPQQKIFATIRTFLSQLPTPGILPARRISPCCTLAETQSGCDTVHEMDGGKLVLNIQRVPHQTKRKFIEHPFRPVLAEQNIKICMLYSLSIYKNSCKKMYRITSSQYTIKSA